MRTMIDDDLFMLKKSHRLCFWVVMFFMMFFSLKYVVVREVTSTFCMERVVFNDGG